MRDAATRTLRFESRRSASRIQHPARPQAMNSRQMLTKSIQARADRQPILCDIAPARRCGSNWRNCGKFDGTPRNAYGSHLRRHPRTLGHGSGDLPRLIGLGRRRRHAHPGDRSPGRVCRRRRDLGQIAQATIDESVRLKLEQQFTQRSHADSATRSRDADPLERIAASLTTRSSTEQPEHIHYTDHRDGSRHGSPRRASGRSRRITWRHDYRDAHGKHASPEEIAEIWKEFKADPKNKELRNRLVEQYLPLVKYNGERIWSRLPDGVELDDLISAGVFGLMDAIDAFDLTRGVKFETYCVPRIRGAMLDELRTMDWVPRLVRSKASKLNEAHQDAGSQARPLADRERAGRAHGHHRRRAGEDDHSTPTRST